MSRPLAGRVPSPVKSEASKSSVHATKKDRPAANCGGRACRRRHSTSGRASTAASQFRHCTLLLLALSTYASIPTHRLSIHSSSWAPTLSVGRASVSHMSAAAPAPHRIARDQTMNSVLQSREAVDILIERAWVPFDPRDKGKAQPLDYADVFSQDLVSVFGNGPEVHGIPGHLASYRQLYENLCYVRRDVQSYDIIGDKIYLEFTTLLILSSDPEQQLIVLRCCHVMKVATSGRDRNRIVRVHGYYDVGPAFDRLFQLGEAASEKPLP
ncbi:hypothetical protein MN608_06335 [Microdochium nivale]|nr:hypothetical protein MN608_06335 [Microdochium nivale]